MQLRVMVYIILGSVSVVSIGAIDIGLLQSVRFLKPFILTMSICLFVLSLILLIRVSNTFGFIPLIRVAGVITAAAATVLFIFTMFIEIPISTYARAAEQTQVIDTGTYALTRHPGLIWMTMFLLGLLLATRAKLLLIAGPIWIFWDVMLALLQDTIIFPRKFGPGYNIYKLYVPMMLPTRASLIRCIRTMKITPKKYR